MNRNEWRDLLSLWQIVLPEDGRSSWEAREVDMTGQYLASYTRSDGPRETRITKTKKHYLRLNGGAALAGSGFTVQKSSIVCIANPLPDTIRGEEVLSFRAEIVDMTIESRMHVEFKRLSVCLLQEIAGAPVQAGQFLAAEAPARSESLAPAEPPALTDDQVGEGIDRFTEILKRIGVRSPEVVDFAVQLGDLMKRDDRFVAEALDRILDKETSEDLKSVLLGTLAYAGTSSAQQALLAVALNPEVPLADRESAMLQIAKVTDPIPEELDAPIMRLAESPSDLSSQAMLLVGVLGNRARDPARLDWIISFIEGSVHAEGSRATALKALGTSRWIVFPMLPGTPTSAARHRSGPPPSSRFARPTRRKPTSSSGPPRSRTPTRT